MVLHLFTLDLNSNMKGHRKFLFSLYDSLLAACQLSFIINIHLFSLRHNSKNYLYALFLKNVTQGTSSDRGFLSVLRGFWRMQARWASPSSCGSALDSSQPLVHSATQS